MQLSRIETWPLLFRLPEPYGDANGMKRYRSIFLIRLITDDGLDGWGECADDLAVLSALFRDRIGPWLIGQPALERSRLTERVAAWHRKAAAAVSMALTEITAKAAGLHVCELWGGRRRQRVPVYASFQSYSPRADWAEASVARIGRALDAGFAAIKVKIGGKPFAEDRRHVVRIQEAYGDRIRLILDGNQSYDAACARKWCASFRHWDNLMWLEEPIPFKRAGDWRLLRQTMGVPLAGGENMAGTADFLPLLSAGALDIVQPDPGHHPDLDAFRETISVARQFGLRVSPHVYDGGLSRLYALFAMGCLGPWSKMEGERGEPVEWDVMDNPLAAIWPIRPENGQVRLPEGPGLGLAPDLDAMRNYVWDGSRYDD